MANEQNIWLYQAVDVYADTDKRNNGQVKIEDLSPNGLDLKTSRKTLTTLNFRNGIIPGGDLALGLWRIKDNTGNILSDILNGTVSDSSAYRFRGFAKNIYPFYQKSDDSLGIGRFNLSFRTSAIPQINPYWTLYNINNGSYIRSDQLYNFITGPGGDLMENPSFGFYLQGNPSLVYYNKPIQYAEFGVSASYLTRTQRVVLSFPVIPKIKLDASYSTTSFLASANLGNFTGPWVDWTLNKAIPSNNPQIFVKNHISLQRPEWTGTKTRLDYKFSAYSHPAFVGGEGIFNTLAARSVYNNSKIPWVKDYNSGPSFVNTNGLNISTSRVEILNTGLSFWKHNSVTGIPYLPYWNYPHPISDNIFSQSGITLSNTQSGIFEYKVFNGEDAPSGFYPDDLTKNNVATLGVKYNQFMGFSKVVNFETGIVFDTKSDYYNKLVKSTYSPITGLSWDVNFNTLSFASTSPTPSLVCDGVTISLGDDVLFPTGYLGSGAGILSFYSTGSTGSYNNYFTRDTSYITKANVSGLVTLDGGEINILTTTIGKRYRMVLTFPSHIHNYIFSIFDGTTTYFTSDGTSNAFNFTIDFVGTNSTLTITNGDSGNDLYISLGEILVYQIVGNNYFLPQLWNSRIKVTNGTNSNKIYVLDHTSPRPWNTSENYTFVQTLDYSLSGPNRLFDISWDENIYLKTLVKNNYDGLKYDGWPSVYHFTTLTGSTTYDYYDFPNTSTGITTYIFNPDYINNPGLYSLSNNDIISNIPLPLTSPTGPLILLVTGPSWGNTLPMMSHLSGPSIGTFTLSTGSFFSSNPSGIGITQKTYFDIPYQQNFSDYGLSTWINLSRTNERSKWSLQPKNEANGLDWYRFCNDLNTGPINSPYNIFDQPSVQTIFPNNIPRIGEFAQMQWYNNMINPGDSYTQSLQNIMYNGISGPPYWVLNISKIGKTDPVDAARISFLRTKTRENSQTILYDDRPFTFSYGSTGVYNEFYAGGYDSSDNYTESAVELIDIGNNKVIFKMDLSNELYNTFGYFMLDGSNNTLDYIPIGGTNPNNKYDSTVYNTYKNNSVLINNNLVPKPNGPWTDSGNLNLWETIASKPTGIKFTTGGVFNDYTFSDQIDFKRNDNLRIYQESLFDTTPTGITGGDYRLSFINNLNGTTSRNITYTTQKFYSAPQFIEKPIGYNLIGYTGFSNTNKIWTRISFSQMDSNVYNYIGSTILYGGGTKVLPAGIGTSIWSLDWRYYTGSTTLTGGNTFTTHEYWLEDTLNANNTPIGGNVLVSIPTGPNVPIGLYNLKLNASIDISPETNYNTGINYSPTNFRIFGDPKGLMYSPSIYIGFPEGNPGPGIGTVTAYFNNLINFCKSISFDYTSGNDIDMEFRLNINGVVYPSLVNAIGVPFGINPIIGPTLPNFSQLNSDNTIRTIGIGAHSDICSVIFDMGRVANEGYDEFNGDYIFPSYLHTIESRLKIYRNRNPFTKNYYTKDNTSYINNEYIYSDWVELGSFIQSSSNTIYDI